MIIIRPAILHYCPVCYLHIILRILVEKRHSLTHPLTMCAVTQIGKSILGTEPGNKMSAGGI